MVGGHEARHEARHERIVALGRLRACSRNIFTYCHRRRGVAIDIYMVRVKGSTPSNV